MNPFTTLRTNQERLAQAYQKAHTDLTHVAVQLQNTLKEPFKVYVGNPTQSEVIIEVDGRKQTVDLSKYETLTDLIHDIKDWNFGNNNYTPNLLEIVKMKQDIVEDDNQKLHYHLVLLAKQIRRQHPQLTDVSVKDKYRLTCHVVVGDDNYTHALDIRKTETMDDINNAVEGFITFIRVEHPEL